MTNEEIRKRFKFDLEIGMFKKDYPFESITFHGYYKETAKLIKLLIDSGYEGIIANNLENKHNGELYRTQIDVSNKKILAIYWTLTENYNLLPDYIKEYEINYDE